MCQTEPCYQCPCPNSLWRCYQIEITQTRALESYHSCPKFLLLIANRSTAVEQNKCKQNYVFCSFSMDSKRIVGKIPHACARLRTWKNHWIKPVELITAWRRLQIPCTCKASPHCEYVHTCEGLMMSWTMLYKPCTRKALVPFQRTLRVELGQYLMIANVEKPLDITCTLGTAWRKLHIPRSCKASPHSVQNSFCWSLIWVPQWRKTNVNKIISFVTFQRTLRA